MIVEQGNNLSP